MTENAQPGGSDPAPAEAVSTPASDVAQPADQVNSGTTEAGAEQQPPADDAGAEPEAKKSRGVQKRIDELTAARTRAEREADFYRAELERSRQSPQQPQPAREIDVSQWVPPAPKPADFPAGEWDPDYLVAKAEHGLLQKQARAAIQQHQQRQAAVADRARHEVASALDAGGERLGMDIRQVAAEIGSRLSKPVGDAVFEALHGNPDAAEIIHHLHGNRADAEALARMSPAAAVRLVGRIEERLERARAASSATKAPAPVPTVAGGGRAPFNHRDPDVPMDQYANWYTKNVLKKG